MARFTSSKDWELRSDVLYHFFAYHYFTRHLFEVSIDLINLNDVDVQYYNRTSDLVHGLAISHKLADYLINYSLKDPRALSINTHRKRFIAHVREYNLKSAPRCRLYMVGLTEEEIDFLNTLPSLPDADPEVIALCVEADQGKIPGHKPKEFGIDRNRTAGPDPVELESGAAENIHTFAGGIKKFSNTSQSTSQTPSFTGPANQIQHLGWATDGCSNIHVRDYDAIWEQERTVEQSIESCLKRYRERSAAGEPILGFDGDGSAVPSTKVGTCKKILWITPGTDKE